MKNHLLKTWTLWIVAVSFSLTGKAIASISLEQAVSCNFQYSQYMDKRSAETDTQEGVLVWNFFSLQSPQPRFFSGGDTGSVSVHNFSQSDGLSIWLKQGNGAHLFSIWSDGTAFWSKHNDIFRSKATQQFRGTCTDIRKTD